MSSAITAAPLNPSGAEPTEEFHCFPELPAELRIRIWQMAYDAIPDTLVYRFRLDFSPISDDELSEFEGSDVTESEAFVVPLEEVRDLTRDLRSLRSVNTECRHEGEPLFDNCLRLNQTEQGGTTDLCPPISLPWKGYRNFFCLVGATELDMIRAEQANTTLIDQIFKTVQLLGFGVDRALDNGLYGYDSTDFAVYGGFILRFTQIRHVALVSDQLMSETDLDGIGDDIRSCFTLSCWDDWYGRVHEDIIDSHCENPKLITKEDHLRVLDNFAADMITSEHIFGTEKLGGINYNMIFRTQDNLDFLLWEDDLLDTMLSDDSSDDASSEEFDEADEDA